MAPRMAFVVVASSQREEGQRDSPFLKEQTLLLLHCDLAHLAQNHRPMSRHRTSIVRTGGMYLGRHGATKASG